MCHLEVFGLNLTGGHILSPRMLPVVRLSSINPLCSPGVVVEPTTETNMEPNEFNFWGEPAPVNSPWNCRVCLSFAPCCSFHLFLSLLIFVILSCRLLFLSCCQVFCLLRLTLEGCAANTEPNTYPKISHDLFLEVFWFQLFPHHRPGTWIGIKTWAQYEVKSRVARKSLTWNFQGKRLKNHVFQVNLQITLPGCRSLCDNLFKFHVCCFRVQFGFSLGLHWVPCKFLSDFIEKVSCMISWGTKSTWDRTIGSC